MNNTPENSNEFSKRFPASGETPVPAMEKKADRNALGRTAQLSGNETGKNEGRKF